MAGPVGDGSLGSPGPGVIAIEDLVSSLAYASVMFHSSEQCNFYRLYQHTEREEPFQERRGCRYPISFAVRLQHNKHPITT
jgi:hypothetical protein